MAKTVVALYDDLRTARDVIRDLVGNGFDRDNISLMAGDTDETYREHEYVTDYDQEDMDYATARRRHYERADDDSVAAEGAGIGAIVGGLTGLVVGLGAITIPGLGPIIAAGPIVSTLVGAGVGAAAGGVLGALVDLGVPEEEAEYYAEGVRRGNTLVVLQTSDARVNDAVDIMERHNPIDIERRASRWEEQGWTGYDAGAGAYAAEDYDEAFYAEDEDTIEVVEEDVRFGKREVERGGVRVRSYIVEEPVEEDVTVRDEHIDVQRRKVDRPATEADFREETVEMTETDEEVVVGKEARVTEEVTLEKGVEERTEHVRETARHTEVEIENLGPREERARQYGAYADYDTDFRRHYQQNYATTNYDYEYYLPAYRYGYDLATHERYGTRDWSDVEPEARRRWEAENQGTWDRVKAAVRHAWNETRRRV